MNAVMVWKEYRHQRSTWIAVTVLAVLLAEGFRATAGAGSLWLWRVDSIHVAPAIVLIGTIIAYGIISGALLLSSEKEDGTLDFLDNLTGRRRPVWRGKLCAGILLTVSQSLVMAGYFVARDIGAWPIAILLPPLSLIALTWGLLGGALCRHVLTATLAATACMAAFWALFYPLSSRAFLIIAIEIGASLAATITAGRIFCRVDRQRSIARSRETGALGLRLFASWQSIFWLVFRQGRWLLLGSAVIAVVLAFTANFAPFVIWPAGSLALGLACGLAVFSPDQRSGRLFWGAQGLSRGRIWNAKLVAWAGILAVVLTFTWLAIASQAKLDGTLQGANNSQQRKRSAESILEPFSPTTALSVWQGPLVEPERGLDPLMFLMLWPVYGFGIGLFLGQVMQRPIIALILSIFVAPVVAALWLPSFLIGGLPLWQALIVPLMLMLTSRLIQRPWISDRLWNARSVMSIVVVVILMAGWQAGCLWYRVIEVPDVGEPFDEKAFLASLPSQEDNKAGNSIRHLINLLEGEKIIGSTYGERANGTPRSILGHALTEAAWFEEDARRGKWLDDLFKSSWYVSLREAAAMPLGVFQDPRSRSYSSPFLQPSETQDLSWVIRLRIHQLIAKGDLQGALSLFETTLGLSRQLLNCAPLQSYLTGVQFENVVLRPGLDSWLQKVGSDKALLQAALTMLQKHEAARPDPANSIKTEYFTQREMDPFARHPDSLLDTNYRKLAVEAPWEKARQQRVFRAITLGALRLVHPPYSSILLGPSGMVIDPLTRVAQQEGLPPKTGAGADLFADDWGAFILQSWPAIQSNYVYIEQLTANSAVAQQTAEVAVAVRLYQADQGHLPAQLQELVPKYLPELPKETGLPTEYQFEETEELVAPMLVTNLVSMGVSTGDASLLFASALANMSRRAQFPIASDQTPMGLGSPGGGAGAAPGDKMMGVGWPGPGSLDQPLLVPHAIIRVGNSFRIVPTARQR